MKTKPALQTLVLATICLTIVTVSALPPPTTTIAQYGTPERARHVVQCLLGLIWKITPYIMLALLALAGLRLLGGQEGRAGRIMARKHILEAIIGFMCIVGLMAVASLLDMPPIENCIQGTPVPPITPGGSSAIICPSGNVITETGVC